MKRFLFFLAVVLTLTLPMAAQTVEAPTVDPTTVEAILVILGGGIVTLITQVLKKALKAEGFLVLMITGIVGIGVVAVYFLFIQPPLVLVEFLLYSVVVFGEATGLYHLYQKR
jgi:hypothetical protein